MEKESQHLQLLSLTREKPSRTNQMPLHKLLTNKQLGSGGANGSLAMRRNIAEARLTQARTTPSYTFEVNTLSFYFLTDV
jgi:hypothetical protein